MVAPTNPGGLALAIYQNDGYNWDAQFNQGGAACYASLTNIEDEASVSEDAVAENVEVMNASAADMFCDIFGLENIYGGDVTEEVNSCSTESCSSTSFSEESSDDSAEKVEDLLALADSMKSKGSFLVIRSEQTSEADYSQAFIQDISATDFALMALTDSSTPVSSPESSDSDYYLCVDCSMLDKLKEKYDILIKHKHNLECQ